MKVYVGMDVHSKECVFVAQDESGKMVRDGRIPTSIEGLRQLREKYELPEGTQVALETGTTAFFVARLLSRLGFKPMVVDAAEVRIKAHRPNQKSDRRDAIELCEGLRSGMYRSIVHIPSLETQELRVALSRRRHFVRLMTREVNAVKHLLRSEGLAGFVTSLSSDNAWKRFLDNLSFAPLLQRLAEFHHTVWSCAQEQVRLLEEEIARLKAPFADKIDRLQAIPGVGPIVAPTVVAVLSDVSRFPTSKHVSSYAGLVPSTYQTGDREYQGRITKKGSTELRSMLCEAAHHANKPQHPLNPYFAKLCARRGYRMATVAVAHRLLRIMYAMLRDGTEFDQWKLGVEPGPFEVTTTRWYRLKDRNRESSAA